MLGELQHSSEICRLMDPRSKSNDCSSTHRFDGNGRNASTIFHRKQYRRNDETIFAFGTRTWAIPGRPEQSSTRIWDSKASRSLVINWTYERPKGAIQIMYFTLRVFGFDKLLYELFCCCKKSHLREQKCFFKCPFLQLILKLKAQKFSKTAIFNNFFTYY